MSGVLARRTKYPTSGNTNIFYRFINKFHDQCIYFFLCFFTAKNLPEERETHSHTAEQPHVQQTPAGTITPLHLSKAFFFSKNKAYPSTIYKYRWLLIDSSKDAEFLHLLDLHGSGQVTLLFAQPWHVWAMHTLRSFL